MTREETKLLMQILSTAYPKTYKSMGREEMLDQLNLWEMMFCGYDFAVVKQACTDYIKANEYPPTIAGLKRHIDYLLPKENAAEAFELIRKACGNSTYNAREEFDKLPESCKKWVGSPSALRELGQVETSIFNTVVKGEFIKTFGEVQKRSEAQAQLPESVRAVIGEMNFMAIGGGEGE